MEMYPCDNAILKLNRKKLLKKLFYDCLELKICPKCGNDLKKKCKFPYGEGKYYGSYLYCSECKKKWWEKDYNE